LFKKRLTDASELSDLLDQMVAIVSREAPIALAKPSFGMREVEPSPRSLRRCYNQR
jgi:hypothetical protein